MVDTLGGQASSELADYCDGRLADTRGDGLGYDIQSFNADGSPRLIEVKTTGLGKDFPFIVTANEVRVSGRDADRYQLYRLFNFGRAPHVYMLRGDLTQVCRLDPRQYWARPGRHS